MYMPPIRLAACAAMALIAVVAGPPSAAAQDDNPIVATVNGEEIRRDEVIDTIRRLPAQIQQMPPDILIPAIAGRIVDSRLMAARAYAENLQDHEDVKRRVAEAEREIVQGFWVEQEITSRVTEEAVAAAYEDMVAANPPAEEVNARHILVETEDEGKALIQRLTDGEDFATLAAEASIGPTGPSGGDLGYFTKEQMVQPFAEAAFAMDTGAFSDSPVQTQFGWHVIMVEDRRMAPPPGLETVREQIENGLAEQYYQEIVAELRVGADIVMFGPDGEALEPLEPSETPETPEN